MHQPSPVASLEIILSHLVDPIQIFVLQFQLLAVKYAYVVLKHGLEQEVGMEHMYNNKTMLAN